MAEILFTKIIQQDCSVPFSDSGKKAWYKPAKLTMNNLDRQGIAGYYGYNGNNSIKMIAWANSDKSIAYLEKRGWTRK